MVKTIPDSELDYFQCRLFHQKPATYMRRDGKCFTYVDGIKIVHAEDTSFESNPEIGDLTWKPISKLDGTKDFRYDGVLLCEFVREPGEVYVFCFRSNAAVDKNGPLVVVMACGNAREEVEGGDGV